MSYDVRILRRAEDDPDTVTGWLAQGSPAGASRWLDSFEDVLDALEFNPQQFGLAPENEHTPYGIHQAIFKTARGLPYRALFTIGPNQVRILRICGPGQDVLDFEDL